MQPTQHKNNKGGQNIYEALAIGGVTTPAPGKLKRKVDDGVSEKAFSDNRPPPLRSADFREGPASRVPRHLQQKKTKPPRNATGEISLPRKEGGGKRQRRQGPSPCVHHVTYSPEDGFQWTWESEALPRRQTSTFLLAQEAPVKFAEYLEEAFISSFHRHVFPSGVCMGIGVALLQEG